MGNPAQWHRTMLDRQRGFGSHSIQPVKITLLHPELYTSKACFYFFTGMATTLGLSLPPLARCSMGLETADPNRGSSSYQTLQLRRPRTQNLECLRICSLANTFSVPCKSWAGSLSPGGALVSKILSLRSGSSRRSLMRRTIR